MREKEFGVRHHYKNQEDLSVGKGNPWEFELFSCNIVFQKIGADIIIKTIAG